MPTFVFIQKFTLTKLLKPFEPKVRDQRRNTWLPGPEPRGAKIKGALLVLLAQNTSAPSFAGFDKQKIPPFGR